MGDERKLRLFVALAISAEILEKIQRVQQSLGTTLAGDEVRWVPIDKLHLTLVFLGHVPPASAVLIEERLENVAAVLPAFDLAAAHLGCFPGAKAPKVIWIGVAGDLDALHELQRQISLETAELAAQQEERSFRPHLTIGRVAPAPVARLRVIGDAIGTLNRQTLDLGRWNVSEVLLLQSQLNPDGARHRVIAKAPLRK